MSNTKTQTTNTEVVQTAATGCDAYSTSSMNKHVSPANGTGHAQDKDFLSQTTETLTK